MSGPKDETLLLRRFRLQGDASVSVDDPARAAIELLVGDQQALLVTRDGAPEGIVTRTDLLEALAGRPGGGPNIG